MGGDDAIIGSKNSGKDGFTGDRHPDLILSEINLPNGAGFRLLRDIRALGPERSPSKSHQPSGSGIAIPPGIRKWLREECELTDFSCLND
jgi:CheY-like chemotaxis protein